MYNTFAHLRFLDGSIHGVANGIMSQLPDEVVLVLHLLCADGATFRLNENGIAKDDSILEHTNGCALVRGVLLARPKGGASRTARTKREEKETDNQEQGISAERTKH